MNIRKNFLGILLAVIVIIVLAPILRGCAFTKIQTIDHDFDGLLSSKLQDKVKFNTSKNSGDRNISVLMVHGIGRHCIGYANELVTGIAKQMNLTEGSSGKQSKYPSNECPEIDDYNSFDKIQNDQCQSIHDDQNDDQDCHSIILKGRYPDKKMKGAIIPLKPGIRQINSSMGYIRTQNYLISSGDLLPSIKLKLYELTWDSSTRWAKSTNVGKPDSEDDNSREGLNKHLKNQIINESIADAVLYLGDYQPFMQYPILMAFCKIVSDISFIDGQYKVKKDNYPFECDYQGINSRLKNNPHSNREIAILTHSLGTRMVFDTLGLLSEENFPVNYWNEFNKNGASLKHILSHEDILSAKAIRSEFQQRVGKIFTLANQVPLLELGIIDTPASTSTTDDLGVGFAKFLEGRVNGGNKQNPLQLVTFTDPNDLLSYNLKCWYFHRVLKHLTKNKKSPKKGEYDFKVNSCKLPPISDLNHNDAVKDHDVLWESKLITITDVTLDLRGLEYPYVFDYPPGAHSAYFSDKDTYKLIACGGSQGKNEADECRN